MKHSGWQSPPVTRTERYALFIYRKQLEKDTEHFKTAFVELFSCMCIFNTVLLSPKVKLLR